MRKLNIAIVGLGQIGIYLYNELRLKKKEIEKKTGKKIKVVAVSARNINKKRQHFRYFAVFNNDRFRSIHFKTFFVFYCFVI